MKLSLLWHLKIICSIVHVFLLKAMTWLFKKKKKNPNNSSCPLKITKFFQVFYHIFCADYIAETGLGAGIHSPDLGLLSLVSGRRQTNYHLLRTGQKFAQGCRTGPTHTGASGKLSVEVEYLS